MNKAVGLLIIDGLKSLTHTKVLATEAMEQREALVESVDQLYQRLAVWDAAFVKGRSQATIIAVRSDWQQYIAWCEGTGTDALPCSVEQLESFIANAIDRKRKNSTVSRYVYTIGLIHQAAGLPNPNKDPLWKLLWPALVESMALDGGNEVKQARALTAVEIEQILTTLGDSPIDLRDAALLSVASDTLCRESELVRIDVADIQQDHSTGTWSLKVRFSKIDRAGTGKDRRYLSAETVEKVRLWRAISGITEGRIFRPIRGRPKTILVKQLMATAILQGREKLNKHEMALLDTLRPQEVARIFRRRAKAAGIVGSHEVSGHSARVGSANDLINNGYSTPQTMHAGGWKSEAMVMRYTRNSRAGQNAMADLRSKKK